MARGLGRGLDALFLDTEAAYENAHSEQGVTEVDITNVFPNPDQPRKNFEENALAELSRSIKEHGVIMPLVVVRSDGGKYMIVAGERRYRAAIRAGLSAVPVIVKELDEKEVQEISLIENLQREDLNPIEAAYGMKRLMEEFSMTQEGLSEKLGKSRPAITNTLRLLALPEDLLELVAQDQLSAGHARALLAAPTPALQRAAAKRVIAERLSVRQTEALIKTLQKEPKKTQRAADDPIALYLGEVEKTLSGQLGRKVTITAKGDKGRIQLEYYNSQDLDSLLTWLQAHGREGDILYE